MSSSASPSGSRPRQPSILCNGVDPFQDLLEAFLVQDPAVASWPDQTLVFLQHARIDAVALLEFRAGHLRVSLSCHLEGRGWPTGSRVDPGVPLASGPAVDSLLGGDPHQPVEGTELWRHFLTLGGYRRCVYVPITPQKRFPLLICARASPRPFPHSGLDGARKLALAVAVGQRTSFPAMDETAFLLASSRTFSRAVDFRQLDTGLQEAVDKVLDWEALCLVPGHVDPAIVRIRGGGGMGPTGRQSFENQLKRQARSDGLRLDRMIWDRTLPPGDFTRFQSPLVLPLSWSRGRAGILAIQPAAGKPLGEEQHRLVTAIAGQASLAIMRLAAAAGREEGRLEGILQSLPCGVVLTDGNERVRRFNPAARRLLSSLNRREVETGRPVNQLGLPGITDCTSVPVEFCGIADQRIYSALSAPAIGGDEPGGGVMIVSDVTQQRARREQAQQAERMSSLGTMLSGVAHELNNPLASVIGFSELLLKQSHEEKSKRRLEIVVSEAQRCRRIVRGLLEVARAPVPERTMISINTLVDGVVSLFQYPLKVDDIDFTWTPGADLPLVMGDRSQLQQVLVNLLSNAQQSLQRKHGERCLKLETRTVHDRVLIVVTDNGPGIPASHLRKIFTPFFTTKEAGSGTGLGLSIVKTVLEEHGGSLKVRSSSGRGAVFTIELPAALRIMQQEQPVDRADLAVPLSGCRALIADDEGTFRQMLRESLESEGVLVKTVQDGLAGLEILQSYVFDVIISDLKMPGLNGIQLLKEAVHLRPGIQARFILTTGALPAGPDRQFIQDQGVICLHKPFGLEELFRAMQRVRRVSRTSG